MPGSACSAERSSATAPIQLDMIAVNIRALTDLSLRFSDQLIRNRGGILNLGSIAGFLPGPGMAVYYATKAYVLSFTEAMRGRAGAAWRARDGALSRSGAVRIPGARRASGPVSISAFSRFCRPRSRSRPIAA